MTIENIQRPGHFRAMRDAFSKTMRGAFRFSVARLDWRNKVNPMTGQKLYEYRRKQRISQAQSMVESTKQARELQLLQMMSRTEMLSNEDSPRKEPETRWTNHTHNTLHQTSYALHPTPNTQHQTLNTKHPTS